MEKKEVIHHLRDIAENGPKKGVMWFGQRSFALLFADLLERTDIPYHGEYLRENIVQLTADAWELLRTSPDAADHHREQYLLEVGYHEVPELFRLGASPRMHVVEARQSVGFLLHELYSREHVLNGAQKEQEWMELCRAQEQVLLAAVQDFARCVWRRGLYDAVKGKRRAEVFMDGVIVRIAVMASNRQLTFRYRDREVWFAGGPDDALGLEFGLANFDDGITLASALEAVRHAIDYNAKLRTALAEKYPVDKISSVIGQYYEIRGS